MGLLKRVINTNNYSYKLKCAKTKSQVENHDIIIISVSAIKVRVPTTEKTK